LTVTVCVEIVLNNMNVIKKNITINHGGESGKQSKSSMINKDKLDKIAKYLDESDDIIDEY